MPPLSESSIVVAAPDVLAADFSSDVVLLNLHDGVYYGLDDVGARVWTLLQSPMAVRALLAAITSEFDVDPARCARDLQSFVDELVRRGLVELRGDGR